MNNFVELEDGPWFDTSLGMAGTLNAAFNKSWGTVTCKSTDVPGMSRSSIPHFAAAGKLALHIGYNSACRVPDIPMAFNWVHEETGTQVRRGKWVSAARHASSLVAFLTCPALRVCSSSLL